MNNRITRILKCLSIIGHKELQFNWLKFIVTEIFITNKLSFLKEIYKKYWFTSLIDKNDQQILIDLQNIPIIK